MEEKNLQINSTEMPNEEMATTIEESKDEIEKSEKENESTTNIAAESETIEVMPTSIDLLTVEIKFHLNQMVYHIIEVGKRLISAKKLVEHGEWKNWLIENFNLSYQTAAKFMQVAERFSKVALMRHFNSTQLIAMLSLPAGEEENFIIAKDEEGTPAQNMTIKQLNTAVKEYKAELEKTKAESGEKIARLEKIHPSLNDALKDNREVIDKLIIEKNTLETQLREKEKQTAIKVIPDDYEPLKKELKELKTRPPETVVPSDYHSLQHNEKKLTEENKNLRETLKEIRGSIHKKIVI